MVPQPVPGTWRGLWGIKLLLSMYDSQRVGKGRRGGFRQAVRELLGSVRTARSSTHPVACAPVANLAVAWVLKVGCNQGKRQVPPEGSIFVRDIIILFPDSLHVTGTFTFGNPRCSQR